MNLNDINSQISFLKQGLQFGAHLDGLDKSFNIKDITIKDYTVIVYYYPEIKNRTAVYMDFARIVSFSYSFLGNSKEELSNKNIRNIAVQALVDGESYIYIISSLDAAGAITEGNSVYWLKNSIIEESFLEKQEILLLVEGESEKVAFPIIFESMGYRIDIHRICIYPFSNSNLKSTLEILKYKGDKYYLVCDKDKEKDITDLEREGLLSSNFHLLKEGEFEDYIQSSVLVKILKSLTPNVEISSEYIDGERKQGVLTSKIVSKYYHTNPSGHPAPKKPVIAEKIALYWAENKIPAEFEEVIKAVLNLC